MKILNPKELKLAKQRNREIRAMNDLYARWKLMKFDTVNQKFAKNAICKRLDEMFKKLNPDKVK